MATPRFYCPVSLPTIGSFELTPDAAHHAHRVLRLRTGDLVQVFNGFGHACEGDIIEISSKLVVIEVKKTYPPHSKSALHIILAQAMSSSEKMDWVVQKATELGATEIHPVQTKRSVAKLNSERAEKRADHWRGVVIAACEQCGRNDLMQVHTPQELTLWLSAASAIEGSKFILLPGATSTLQSQTKPNEKVILLIGPEGGFSSDEVLMAKQAGFIPIFLGPRVLRTETAALAGITALQLIWGDLCSIDAHS